MISSPRVNVLYGVCNLALSYTLLHRIGDFDLRNLLDAGAFGIGLTLWSLMIVRSLEQISEARG